MENNQENYVHAGMHLQGQKIGRSEKEKQEIINDFHGDSRFDEIKKSEVIGLDLTVLQNQSLNAVQSLLEQTGYKGNMPSSFFRSSALGMDFDLPVIKFTPARFYETFGLNKHKVGEYEQYYGGDCKQALGALRSLYHKEFIFCYTRKSFEKGKEDKTYVKYYTTLFCDVVEDYKDNVKEEKRLKYITMTLSPIFIDQIQNYHVAKPKGYINEIKRLYPRGGKFVHLFIEYVLFQSRLNRRRGVVRVKEETLAYQLRMNNYIKSGKRSKIRETIKKALEIARETGFVSNYKYGGGMIEFSINYGKLIKVDSK